MWQLTLWTSFLLVALSLAPVQKVAACSCQLQHPQTTFCSADFVAVVRVKRQIRKDDEVAYKVKINKVFKSNAKSEMILKQNVLWGPSMDSLCGVSLRLGENYVVSGRIHGGKATISLCGLAMRWSEVNPRQRKGFRRLYQRGCACQIMYTPWWRKGEVLESSGGKRCLWESNPGPQDCQEKYGVCKVGLAGCSWAPSQLYKECITEHQRQRELQRLREP